MKKLEFWDAFNYPFKRAKRMWNILWMFVPIYGWFALGGYSVRIVRGFIKGDFSGMPKMTAKKDFGLGFMIFIKFIPLIAVFFAVISIATWIHDGFGFAVNVVASYLILPMLSIHFLQKGTVRSSFELEVLNGVFSNFADYLLVLVKSFALAIVYLPLILVLVGIPASTFTKNIFLADFYRRRVKK